MASKYYPRQNGTTVTEFEIGAGTGKAAFKIDASSLTSPITWHIPTTNGSLGNVLTNDGAGGLSWASPGAATVSGVIIGDTDCGLISDIITAMVDFTNAGDMPSNTINLGSV